MKLITRDIDYAIRALLHAKTIDKDIFSVSDIVKATKIPQPFLRRIFQTLSKNNILTSIKGKGGGFKLNKKLNKIYLLDIIKSFQKDFTLLDCMFNKHLCPDRKKCALRKEIMKVELKVINHVKGITLDKLSKKIGGK